MTNTFTLQVKNQRLEIRTKKDGKPLLRLEPKQWESRFFKRKFGQIILDPNALDETGPRRLRRVLKAATDFADDQAYRIIEVTLDASWFGLVPLWEDTGFRLVDSKMTFLTLIEKPDFPRFQVQTGRIEWADTTDLDAIITLTHAAFVDNPRFYSRFKNQRYFTIDESRAYYAAWITNHFSASGSIFAVWCDTGQCRGYFFYQRRGQYKGYPVLKGMLAAVDNRYREQKAHLALQTFLFDQIRDPVFWVDNTTQFTNFPVIKNHITSQRKLDSISMVLYREHPLYIR